MVMSVVMLEGKVDQAELKANVQKISLTESGD